MINYEFTMHHDMFFIKVRYFLDHLPWDESLIKAEETFYMLP